MSQQKHDCIFCQIVAGSAPSHTIWEDDAHLAFLSIFPNTEGFSVVIPKDHHVSYVADAPDDVASKLFRASCTVAKRIDAALDDVGRTGFMFEGFGVDHLHAKLFPMHGTSDMQAWRPFASPINTYFDRYLGYISSHDAERGDDTELAALAEKIRAA